MVQNGQRSLAKLQSTGSQRVGHDLDTEHAHAGTHTHTHTHTLDLDTEHARVGTHTLDLDTEHTCAGTHTHTHTHTHTLRQHGFAERPQILESDSPGPHSDCNTS